MSGSPQRIAFKIKLKILCRSRLIHFRYTAKEDVFIIYKSTINVENKSKLARNLLACIS